MALSVHGEGGDGSRTSEDGPGSLSCSSHAGRHRGSGLPAALLLPPWKPPHQRAAAGRLSATVSLFLEPNVFQKSLINNHYAKQKNLLFFQIFLVLIIIAEITFNKNIVGMVL